MHVEGVVEVGDNLLAALGASLLRFFLQDIFLADLVVHVLLVLGSELLLLVTVHAGVEPVAKEKLGLVGVIVKGVSPIGHVRGSEEILPLQLIQSLLM